MARVIFQMIGGGRMVGPLGVLSRHFGPCTSRETVGDRTTTLRQRDVGAVPNSQSPKDTANIYASYFRSHFSQQTPRLSHGAERSFMNNLRSDQCSDSSLHNTFCSPFSTKKLTTAISKLSTSTTSGTDLIAYLLLTYLSPSAQ